MRHMFYQLHRSFVFLLFVTALGVTANAQFKASIQGTVTDTSGAIVSGATVIVTDTETNKTQTAVTGDDGFYRVTGLAPGKYKVTAELSGFKKKVLEAVVVHAEEAQGVNITLDAGQVAESVTVSATSEVPLQTENANVNKTITNLEVLRLPQAGRDPYDLIRLAPGVFGEGARTSNGGAANLPNTSGPGGSSLSIFATENQVPVTANGQRVSSNNFQIDGVSVNSQTWGGAAVITPSQESIKELQVTSSTYSAEDGRNSGAQVKVVTQNGTNSLHGSGFFRYAGPSLNAFNKFLGIPGTTRTSIPQRVEQLNRSFGGSLGGPIVKDKLFFFFSYEGFRSSTNNTFQSFIETSQLRQLIVSGRPNGLAAKVLTSPGIEPRVVTILSRSCADFAFQVPSCQNVGNGFDIGSPTGAKGQYVLFNQPLGGGLDGIADLQYALLANPTTFSGNQYFTRADYIMSSKDTLAFTAYFTPVTNFTSNSGAQSRPMADITSKRFNWDAGAIYTRNISATMLNEARFNFTRWSFNEVDSNPNVNFGIPRIEIEGLLPGGDRLRFGADRSENTPGILKESQIDFRDALSKVTGNHALKFGGEYRIDLNDDTGTGGARPLFSFVRPWNFANDTPIFEAINADANGAPQANNTGFKSGDLAFFVQDDWKLRPNVTLNLGLRWEYYQPITARNGQLGNLVLGPQGLVGAKVVTVDKLSKSDLNNFGPQIGFAWSPAVFHDKAVLRGGFGIGYDRLPNALLANARANPPNGARYGICCGTAGAADGFGTPFVDGQILYALGSSNSPFSYPVNPKLGGGIDPNTGAPKIGAIEIYGTAPDLPNAYLYRYSLEAQVELPAKLTATLGYQGSAGHKFVRIVPEHLVLPTANPDHFSAVYFAVPDVNTNYNAMLARLQRRFSNGLQFDLNYRFSKSIDNSSFEAPCGCTNQTFPVDQRQERGPSDFDVKHYFVGSTVWEVPFLREQKDWTGKLLGGWQISGIVTWHSGFPWTPRIDQGLRGPNGNFFGPIRPTVFFGKQPAPSTNHNFLQPGGIFPGGGSLYFNTSVKTDATGTPTFQLNPPGIGRNSFRGPRYFSADLSLAKRFGLPRFGVLGERAGLDLRFNLFNTFNTLNLAPFQAGSGGVFVNRPTFGEPDSALAGRVIEFQARFSF
jgi:carboxypeptidase family protein/TonB-dependent receptor-like protein